MARRAELDDAGLLRLLWEPAGPTAPRPGPKASLALDAIIAAGIAIADDRDGPALSMRLVADRLGCTPMALYSYVDTKRTLVRLMYDRAHAEFPDTGGETPHEQVQEWARALTDLYVRHHWLSEVSWSRPVLGPHEQAVLEALLRRLQPLGLASVTNGTVASTLLSLCRQSGRLIADARHAHQASGLSDEDWWAAQSAAMAAVVPDFAARFPLSASTRAPVPRESPSPGGGNLERAARVQLEHAVRLILSGASATRDAPG